MALTRLLIVASTIVFTLISSLSHSQTIGDWNVYASYSTVNDIVYLQSDEIVAGTLGGIFTISDQQIDQTLTTVDGIYRLNPTVLQKTASGDILAGYTDGTLELIDLETLDISRIEDIKRVTQFSSNSINDIIMEGNAVYVATDFGILEFDQNEFIVRNSFLSLGNFQRGSPVNAIDIEGDSIFAATSEGVAKANLSDNLLDRRNWQNSTIDALNPVEDILSLGSLTYAVSDGGLYQYKNNIWVLNSDFTESTVLALEKQNAQIGIVSNTSISIINERNEKVFEYLDNSVEFRSVCFTNDVVYIGTSSLGLLVVQRDNQARSQFVPEGPFLNLFGNLDVSNQTLLSASTIEFPQFDPFNPIRGYYILKENEWQSFNQSVTPELDDFNVGSVYQVAQNKTHYTAGSWGRGVVVQDKETLEIKVFNSFNSELSGITANRNFVVISALDIDSNEQIWAVSYDSDKPLNRYSVVNDEWLHLDKVSLPSDNLYFRLFIDSNNQKWISLIDFSNNGKGLLVLNTGTDEVNTADDTFRKLTANESNGNLPDENVTAFLEDKNGEVWIGTKRGIARFIFPEFITESNNASEYRAQWLINSDTAAISRFLLRDVNVTTMAVNGANEKWIGSENQGIWVLNEDGSKIVRRYTAENSPLLSNNIFSIAINEHQGEVFISTDLGLISFREIAKASVPEMEQLKVFPNPFVYTQHNRIIIEGLSEQTTIRIVAADGSVVHQFEARGGSIDWNGFNQNGEKLGSGVYFVIALSQDGSQKGIGKIVIIK